MEEHRNFLSVWVMCSVAITALYTVNAQSSTTSCTGAMMRSLSPCVGFLYGGSGGSSPTSECCGALRSLMSTGQDCLCLFVTGGTPFQVPINNSLAMSLPRACKMSGVPIECKAAASPVPSPDTQNPGQGGSNSKLPPRLSPPSPTAPFMPETPPETNINTPPAPDDIIPTLTPPGMRPTLLSAATHSCHITYLPALLLALLGTIFVNS